MSVWAVLAAAGRGERLGDDRPKAFARLGNLPLVAEPLRRLDDSDWIDGIIVAAPAGWEEPVIVLAEELAAGKVRSVVTGAETRAGSVRGALAEVPDEAVVIVVHDAARPFVTEDVLGRVIAPLSDGFDGAVPVLKLTDKVKRIRRDEVVETLDREGLVVTQTPQAFLAGALRRAAAGEGTDCASLVEAQGGRIKAVAGDPRLLKVTLPEDLELVASWL
ncbi:MAG: 2-C-methyl-D-erythritol 4-phosphate cytidylyltransferase [Gaiellaceae bacterium]